MDIYSEKFYSEKYFTRLVKYIYYFLIGLCFYSKFDSVLSRLS